MARPNPRQPFLTVPPALRPDAEAVRRFLVLVPAVDADLTPLTRRVWELADAKGAQVKLLGLYQNSAQELGLRRRLVTSSALVNSASVWAEAELVRGRDWVSAVRARWQPGDAVICLDEPRGAGWREPLDQILRAKLDAPVYILSGLYAEERPRPSWPARAVAWIGSLVIVGGFFVLQADMEHFAKGWTIVGQLLSLPVEFWLIWVWNSLF